MTENFDFEKWANLVRRFRTPHAHLIGMQVLDCVPGQVRMRIPFHPVFVGADASDALHGGVVTTMLDESCGVAVQLALKRLVNIATLDLRIDYMRPAVAGADLFALATCYRLTRSIAFVRAVAYQETETDPVASVAATFMIRAHNAPHRGRATEKSVNPAITYEMLPKLEAPAPANDGIFGPYARFLGIEARQDGDTRLPYDLKLTGNPMLPALHGGAIGAFLETTAFVCVQREIGDALPKPIGLTINYLRSGKPLDTFGSCKIVKQGRRVVAFEAHAWQTSRSAPIASAYGHFILKRENSEHR